MHFARHGQATHNVALAHGRAGPEHVDSRRQQSASSLAASCGSICFHERLTKLGEEQAAAIARNLQIETCQHMAMLLFATLAFQTPVEN